MEVRDTRAARVFERYLDTPGPDHGQARDAVVVRTDGAFPEVTRTWRLGTVDACLFEGAAIDVTSYRWSPPPQAHGASGMVLGHVVEGVVEVAQAARRVRLEAGDSVFYDVGSPFGLHSEAHHRYLVAQIPVRLVDLRDADRAAVVTRPLRAYGGAAALRALLETLVAEEAGPAPGVGHYLGDAIVACARAIVVETRGEVLGERSTQLHVELVEWLEAHLAEDHVTTERVAAAHFLSERYVRKLFADQGTTVSAFVRRRRLERIRDDLVQPWALHLPVAAVAARWGMRDPSVFSRGFTRQFGQCPSDYRRDALRPVPDTGSTARSFPAEDNDSPGCGGPLPIRHEQH